jgi:hypothetical protein
MKRFSQEDGYIDSQLPPVILGILLLVGLVHMITSPEFDTRSSIWMPYLGVVIIYAILAFGYYSNMSSLECPESPFNKHQSPLFLGIIIIGGMAYAMRKVDGSAYQHLKYLFGVTIAVAVIMIVCLGRVRKKFQNSIEETEAKSPAEHEMHAAMSKAGSAFKRKDYDQVVQILEPHLKQLPASQRKRYNIAKKHIQE